MMFNMAPEPGPDTIILDPAGLPYIQSGPRGAGGAAGQIYRWLGIGEAPAFPQTVRAAIREPLAARFHDYERTNASTPSVRTSDGEA